MIKEKYEVDFSDRSFDNVLDAVNEAMKIQPVNGNVAVKVYRSVLYTGATDWKRSTLTIIPSKEELVELEARRPAGCVGCGRT